MTGSTGWHGSSADEEPSSDRRSTYQLHVNDGSTQTKAVYWTQEDEDALAEGHRPPTPSWKILVACTVTVVAVAAGLLVTAQLRSARASVDQNVTSPSPQEGSNKSTSGQAIAFELNLPALYPDISARPGSECHTAWAALRSVPCHDAILHRDIDVGSTQEPLWDAKSLVPKICDPRCKPSLSAAYEAVQTSCTASDTFVLGHYEGPFDATLLEAGPTAALEKLVRRSEHLCRKSPDGDSDYEYCPLELRARFGFLDDLHPDLRGVDAFLRQTAERRTEYTKKRLGAHGERIGVLTTEAHEYGAKVQTYGPGPGETSCSWCTFDFLNRTLNSWQEGVVPDTREGSPVPLQDFMLRVKEAGDRCARASTWGRIYNEAVQRYQASGLLPSGWETIPPVDDLDWLITHGPTEGDWPVSQIMAELARLESGEELGELTGSTPPEDVPELVNRSMSCLSAMAKLYTSAPCYISLTRENLRDMGQRRETQPELISTYCGHECSAIIDDMWPPPDCLDGPFTNNLPDIYFQYWAAQGVRSEYCEAFVPADDCSPGPDYTGKTGWASNGRPETTVLMSEVDDELQAFEESLAADLYPDLGRKEQQPWTGRRQSVKLGTERRLGGTVCSRCLWGWVAGRDAAETMRYMRQAASPSAYVEFVRRYHAACTGRGAWWMGGAPHGGDPVVWRERTTGGDVVRYVRGDLREASLRVYGVREAGGPVSDDDVGVGQVTLWHVLLAERKLRAMSESRLERWEVEEAKHRRKADAKIWDSSGPLHRMEYVGAKGVVPEKRGGSWSSPPSS